MPTFGSLTLTSPNQKVFPPQFLEISHQLEMLQNRPGDSDDCTARQLG